MVLFVCHVLNVHRHGTLRCRVPLSTWNACQIGMAAAISSAVNARSVPTHGGTD